MTRTRRAVLTFTSGTMLQVVTMAMSIVTTRLILDLLGNERMGAFRAAIDTLAYLALFEIGIGAALRPMFSQALARDENAVRGVFAAGARAYLRIAAISLVVGVPLVYVLPRLISVDNPNIVSEVRWGGAVGLALVLMLPLSPLRILLDADQRGYVVNLALAAQAILLPIVSVAAAWLGWGVTGQFAASVSMHALFLAALMRSALKRHPRLLHRPSADEAAVTDHSADLRRMNLPAAVLQTCSRVSFGSNTLIVAGLLGPAAVVPFVLTQRLPQQAQAQAQSIGSAGAAGLCDLFVRGEIDQGTRRLAQMTRFTAILAACLLVPIALLNQPFVALWVGAGNYAGNGFTTIFCCWAALHSIVSLWRWPLDGLGKLRELVPGVVVSTVINLAFSLLWTWRFGVVGPVLGSLCSLILIDLWFIPRTLRRTVGVQLRPLVVAALYPVLLSLPIALLAWGVVSHLSIHSFLAIAILGAAVVGVYLMASWWLLIDRADRAIVLTRVSARFRARA